MERGAFGEQCANFKAVESSWNKCMVILVRIPNNVGRRNINWSSLVGMQDFQLWNWVTLGWGVDKGSPDECPQATQTFASTKVAFRIVSAGSIAEDNIQKDYWMWRALVSARIEPSPLCSSPFGVEELLYMLLEEIHGHHPSRKTLDIHNLSWL